MSTMSTEQIGTKELTIGLHVLMKEAPNWTRFTDHKLSADRKSITVTLDDDREFVVSTYEKAKPFDPVWLATLSQWVDSQPEITGEDLHAALVAYVDMWRAS